MDSHSRDVASLVASVNADLVANTLCLCRAGLDSSGGVGLLATRDIKKGERVMVEVPLTATVYVQSRPFACATCLRDSRYSHQGIQTNGWDRSCSQCGLVHFCSEACEMKLRDRHSGCECTALAKIARYEREAMEPAAGPHGGDLVSQAIRILADRHAGEGTLAYPGRLVAVDDCRARLIGTPRGPAARSTIQQAVDVALHAVPSAARVPPEELFDVLSRLQCNCHAICSQGGQKLARAGFVGILHLFNHSCT